MSLSGYKEVSVDFTNDPLSRAPYVFPGAMPDQAMDNSPELGAGASRAESHDRAFYETVYRKGLPFVVFMAAT